MSFVKSAMHQPVWPVIWNIVLPSRLKNTDLGALGSLFPRKADAADFPAQNRRQASREACRL